jgi:excinuclease ABC subunit A
MLLGAALLALAQIAAPPHPGPAHPELVEGLHALVEQGNTVVVIEHNLDVIKTADWILDLGPGGGVNGGEIVAEGTPEQVAANERSFTGQYLKPMLERAPKPELVETKAIRKLRKKASADQPDLLAAK